MAYARSIALLSEDLWTVRPTILISAPRIYGRAYMRIQERLAAKGAIVGWLYALAERIGWRRFLAAQAPQPRRPTIPDAILWLALDRLVAARFRAEFGGRLHVAVTGGAPMPEAVSRCFLAMGINILHGYGMTESAPVVSVNRLGRNDPATVGETIDGVEIRIGDNEYDIRAYVMKRKISGGTVSQRGRQARDVMLGLCRTCKKLGVSFFHFIGDRHPRTQNLAPPNPRLTRSPMRLTALAR